jgi:hypothetical protein
LYSCFFIFFLCSTVYFSCYISLFFKSWNSVFHILWSGGVSCKCFFFNLTWDFHFYTCHFLIFHVFIKCPFYICIALEFLFLFFWPQKFMFHHLSQSIIFFDVWLFKVWPFTISHASILRFAQLCSISWLGVLLTWNLSLE